jgi:hypothetical protein
VPQVYYETTLTGSLFILVMDSFIAMKTRLGILTAAVVVTIFVGLFFGNTNFMVSSASAASSNPLQSGSHVTVQNTATSSQDPLPVLLSIQNDSLRNINGTTIHR